MNKRDVATYIHVYIYVYMITKKRILAWPDLASSGLRIVVAFQHNPNVFTLIVLWLMLASNSSFLTFVQSVALVSACEQHPGHKPRT